MSEVRRRPEGATGLEVALSAVRDLARRLDRFERQVKGSYATRKAVDNASVGPVTDVDVGALTEHRANIVTVAASTWHTVFDLTGQVELLGGSIHGASPTPRITVDGVEVISSVSSARGRDAVGDVYATLVLPAVKAASSLKVEFNNNLGASHDYGWRMWTR